MADHIKIEKLNSVNYATWSYQMKMVLMETDLWSVIEPGEDEPPDDAVANIKKAYITRQGKALAKIALAICDEQQMHIRSLLKAKDVWEELQRLYAPKDSKFRTVQLSVIKYRRSNRRWGSSYDDFVWTSR